MWEKVWKRFCAIVGGEGCLPSLLSRQKGRGNNGAGKTFSGLFPGRGVNRTGKTGKSWERTSYAPEKGSEKGTFSGLFPGRGNNGAGKTFFRVGDFFRTFSGTFSGS